MRGAYINPAVWRALEVGEEYVGGRAEGKTFTLLHFLRARTDRRKEFGVPILIARDAAMMQWLRDAYRDLFSGAQELRWAWAGQRDWHGVSGDIYTEECVFLRGRWPTTYPRFGGGVRSFSDVAPVEFPQ